KKVLFYIFAKESWLLLLDTASYFALLHPFMNDSTLILLVAINHSLNLPYKLAYIVVSMPHLCRSNLLRLSVHLHFYLPQYHDNYLPPLMLKMLFHAMLPSL